MAGKRVTNQVPWTEMSFMSSHVSEGGLEWLLPLPPAGSSSAPSCGYQRRDQHYQRSHRWHSAAPRTTPKPHALATPVLVVTPAARRRCDRPPTPSVFSGPKSGINNLSFAG